MLGPGVVPDNRGDKHTVDRAFLHELANNANREGFPFPVKVTHGDTGELKGKHRNFRVREAADPKDDRLIADWCDVPEEYANKLHGGGTLPFRSAEFDPINKIYLGTAALGAIRPHQRNLAPIDRSQISEQEPVIALSEGELVFVALEEQEVHQMANDPIVANAEAEELRVQLEESKAALAKAQEDAKSTQARLDEEAKARKAAETQLSEVQVTVAELAQASRVSLAEKAVNELGERVTDDMREAGVVELMVAAQGFTVKRDGVDVKLSEWFGDVLKGAIPPPDSGALKLVTARKEPEVNLDEIQKDPDKFLPDHQVAYLDETYGNDPEARKAAAVRMAELNVARQQKEA